MKFSVLLPTRNRLEYLRYAVDSVRKQDDPDWELVVSDNFSEEDIGGFVESLNDARIQYVRTDRPLHVTDNWNNALAHSSGDYIVMLGDDDALLPGYLRRMRELVARFAAPDLIYTGALLYAYPNVMPDSPNGYLLPYGYAEFLQGATEPYVIPREAALSAVRKFCDFQVAYGFNMQFSFVSRRLIDRVRTEGGGAFFQSPFPDYYASNAMLLVGERIVACPEDRVVIGVTPKSYGFYHATAREAEGMSFLDAGTKPAVERRLERMLLPGTNINTQWLMSLEVLRANLGSRFDIPINYRRYRALQILYVHEEFYLHKRVSAQQMAELRRAMRVWERVVCRLLIVRVWLAERIRPGARDRFFRRMRERFRQTPPWNVTTIPGKFSTMTDVLAHFSR